MFSVDEFREQLIVAGRSMRSRLLHGFTPGHLVRPTSVDELTSLPLASEKFSVRGESESEDDALPDNVIPFPVPASRILSANSLLRRPPAPRSS